MTCKHGWNWKQLETCPMCEEVNSAVAAEREACANICDHEQGTAGDAADKIRVRSNA